MKKFQGADRQGESTKYSGGLLEFPSDVGQSYAVEVTSSAGSAIALDHEKTAEGCKCELLARNSSSHIFPRWSVEGHPAGFTLTSVPFFVMTLLALLVSFTAPAQTRKIGFSSEHKNEIYLMSGAQMSRPDRPYLPSSAIKINALYLATTTLNVSFEFGLGRHWTMDIGGAYNPFKLKKEGINQLWMIQPEFRYWFCGRFERHFLGLHGIYGEYNIGQLDFLTTTFIQHRYKGSAVGAGLAWGYHFPMGRRWAMELSLGAGYLQLDYDKFRCYECDDMMGSEKKHYFGPTKAALSVIFMIK